MSLKCKKVLFICLAVQILIQATIVECYSRPKPKSKRKSVAGAVASGLAGFALGRLLNSKKQSSEIIHHHYQNPPTYAVQSVPVVVQQPMVPVYNQQQPVVPAVAMAPVYQQQQQPIAPVYQQQQQPIAPAYQQQQQPIAPAYQQQQQPIAPVYQQQQQPIAPAYQQQQPIPPAPLYPINIAVNPGNISNPVSPNVSATNHSLPVYPMVAAVNQTNYVPSVVPAANISNPVNFTSPIGNHSYPTVVIGNKTLQASAPFPAPILPVGNQQYVPVAPVVALQQPAVASVPMVPVPAQQPNVATAQIFVLSKKTGHYGRNSGDNLMGTSYIAMLLMSVLVFFL